MNSDEIPKYYVSEDFSDYSRNSVSSNLLYFLYKPTDNSNTKELKINSNSGNELETCGW